MQSYVLYDVTKIKDFLWHEAESDWYKIYINYVT